MQNLSCFKGGKSRPSQNVPQNPSVSSSIATSNSSSKSYLFCHSGHQRCHDVPKHGSCQKHRFGPAQIHFIHRLRQHNKIHRKYTEIFGENQQLGRRDPWRHTKNTTNSKRHRTLRKTQLLHPSRHQHSIARVIQNQQQKYDSYAHYSGTNGQQHWRSWIVRKDFCWVAHTLWKDVLWYWWRIGCYLRYWSHFAEKVDISFELIASYDIPNRHQCSSYPLNCLKQKKVSPISLWTIS